MRLETKLNQLLPAWEAFRVVFHELTNDGEGWSVNDSWTACSDAGRARALVALRDRWGIFKHNYMPKARVKDLQDSGDGQESVLLEVNCVAIANP